MQMICKYKNTNRSTLKSELEPIVGGKYYCGNVDVLSYFNSNRISRLSKPCGYTLR